MLKIEAVGSYDMLVPIYKTTGSHIPGDCGLTWLPKYFHAKFLSGPILS
jgi:hypothetical protein